MSENNQEEIDFFLMGERRANTTKDEVNALAKKIENDYGKDARLEFEAGFASAIVPTYINGYVGLSNRSIERIKKGEMHATARPIVNDDYNVSYIKEMNKQKREIQEMVNSDNNEEYEKPKENSI